MSRHRTSLTAAPPFDLRLSLFGHGWIDLPPNEWTDDDQSYATALLAGDAVADVRVRALRAGGKLRVDFETDY